MEWYELIKLASTFFLAFVLSYYLTPIVRKAAIRFGIIDNPNGTLKRQREPVAYLGGLAVFLSFLASVSIPYEFDQSTLGILLGTMIIIILGLIDDFGVLTPKIKIAGQLIAVWVLFKAGISVQITWLPEISNMILTVFWVIGVTNAFNLIDVMDGLSSGVAFIAAVFLAVISFLNGNYLIAAFTFTLAGSLLGFLPHNFRPAKIYLGDTGSLAIGFMLAALTINEQYTLVNPKIGVLAPIIIMGIPIFETVFLIVVRISKGIPPFQGSPDHFSLRLVSLGWSIEGTVVFTYIIGIILGGFGLVIVYGETLVARLAAMFVGVFAVVVALLLLLLEIRSRRKKVV